MGETYRVPVRQDDRTRVDLALDMVAASTGVARQAMETPRLSRRACEARWLAIYLAHIACDWPTERVGHAFGLNRSTVNKACQWAEDARDRPALDEVLERLERGMRLILGARLELAA